MLNIYFVPFTVTQHCLDSNFVYFPHIASLLIKPHAAYHFVENQSSCTSQDKTLDDPEEILMF